ncbi:MULTISPECIES: hypothetical protein [Paenibacillus]|nr:hypothetical protein [Paenibacillus odorifer]
MLRRRTTRRLAVLLISHPLLPAAETNESLHNVQSVHFWRLM